MSSAKNAVRGGRTRDNSNNAGEGASDNIRSNRNEKGESADAEGTVTRTKRTKGTRGSNTGNASSDARGRNMASDNNSSANGGARSATKRSKGESADAEGMVRTATRTRGTQNKLNNDMSSVSDSAKGKAGVRNSQYAGEGASNRESGKKERADGEGTNEIPNNNTSNANADARYKSKPHKGKDNASNAANGNSGSSNAENGDEKEVVKEKAEAGRRSK